MPTGVGNCPYYQVELPPGVDVVLFIHFGGSYYPPVWSFLLQTPLPPIGPLNWTFCTLWWVRLSLIGSFCFKGRAWGPRLDLFAGWGELGGALSKLFSSKRQPRASSTRQKAPSTEPWATFSMCFTPSSQLRGTILRLFGPHEHPWAPSSAKLGLPWRTRYRMSYVWGGDQSAKGKRQ